MCFAVLSRKERVDWARYLAVAPRLLVACFFWLIVAMVIFPVASAGVLHARALCQLMFVVIIAIVIVLDVMACIIAITI